MVLVGLMVLSPYVVHYFSRHAHLVVNYPLLNLYKTTTGPHHATQRQKKDNLELFLQDAGLPAGARLLEQGQCPVELRQADLRLAKLVVLDHRLVNQDVLGLHTHKTRTHTHTRISTHARTHTHTHTHTHRQ